MKTRFVLLGLIASLLTERGVAKSSTDGKKHFMILAVEMVDPDLKWTAYSELTTYSRHTKTRRWLKKLKRRGQVRLLHEESIDLRAGENRMIRVRKRKGTGAKIPLDGKRRVVRLVADHNLFINMSWEKSKEADYKVDLQVRYILGPSENLNDARIISRGIFAIRKGESLILSGKDLSKFLQQALSKPKREKTERQFLRTYARVPMLTKPTYALIFLPI